MVGWGEGPVCTVVTLLGLGLLQNDNIHSSGLFLYTRELLLSWLNSAWVYGCRRVPYQEKHALQQASLLGNMEAFGLLESFDEEDFARRASAPAETTTSVRPAVKQRSIVELGAGRGYLSHMLCDCYTVHKVVMVERRAYKFKVLILKHL